MSLFSRVWIKAHFPLNNPVVYYFQVFIENKEDKEVSHEKKEVSSANNFTLVVRPSVM